MELDSRQLVMDIERKSTRETQKYLAVLLETDDRLRKNPDSQIDTREVERSSAWVSHAVPLLKVHA